MKLDLNVCIGDGGTTQCRYLGEDDKTGKHACLKLYSGLRQAIDTEVDDYLCLTGDSRYPPLPLGDNCPGISDSPPTFREWLGKAGEWLFKD